MAAPSIFGCSAGGPPQRHVAVTSFNLHLSTIDRSSLFTTTHIHSTMPVGRRSEVYSPIPPPPLPEFYLSKAEHVVTAVTSRASLSSSESDADRDILLIREPITAYTGVYRMEPPSTRPLIAMPPTKIDPSNPPPLAIYHICRICLRPRSPR